MRVPGILLTFVSKSFALRRRMREKSGMMSYPVMRFDRPAAEAKQGRNRDHGRRHGTADQHLTDAAPHPTHKKSGRHNR